MLNYSSNKTIHLWLPPEVLEKLGATNKRWTHIQMIDESSKRTQWFVNGVQIKKKRK